VRRASDAVSSSFLVRQSRLIFVFVFSPIFIIMCVVRLDSPVLAAQTFQDAHLLTQGLFVIRYGLARTMGSQPITLALNRLGLSAYTVFHRTLYRKAQSLAGWFLDGPKLRMTDRPSFFFCGMAAFSSGEHMDFDGWGGS
jgi:hypothetical protein